MTQKEFSGLIQISSEEVLVVLASIEGLLTLAEHYQNHPETISCLNLIEACTAKLGLSIHRAMKRNDNHLN